ncbi:hypothetical protein JEQ12_002191 [Ovis aries]|uniref:Uncharacterized protein n=1 Tax=Ovis aries TaxID=9940 RepID=A0A836CYS0_SHEEP|nr:hypothetical protein JEQ12_002191 [Ovis aries]
MGSGRNRVGPEDAGGPMDGAGDEVAEEVEVVVPEEEADVEIGDFEKKEMLATEMWMVQDNFTFAPKVRNANHMKRIRRDQTPVKI